MTLMNGKEVSAKVKADVLSEVRELNQRGIRPGLAVIIVGENPASKIYVRNKKNACESCAIYSEEYALPESTSETELLQLIEKLNQDPNISGILVQSPLPSHINEKTVVLKILPQKDVDAFHPVNVGKILLGDYDFLPCTPAGVMDLLSHYQIGIAGKECVVVGRSDIVGKPMAIMLLHAHGTVTVCHSKTRNLAEVTRRADILVSAVGKANFITGDMIQAGAVVVDVGMNRDADGKLCGDVLFESAAEKAAYLTPVPGGVGPMTIATLMKNTVKAAKIQHR